jgi:dolichyl-phosphate beta-glucosyltransferase
MSTHIRPHLSLVIPAFNEAHRLPQTLKEIRRHSSNWPFSYEVLVVVEPSVDGTLDLARKEEVDWPELQVIANQTHYGKGFAVKTGMLAASGEVVFFTDADLSTSLVDLDRALQLFGSAPSADILVGSRQHPQSQILQHQSWMRELMGKTFNRLVRLLSGIKLLDTQCGFKGFRREACRQIFSRLKTNGFSFDVEALLLAQAMAFRVVEMPVHWSNSPESKVRVVQDSLRMLQEVSQVRKLVRATMRSQPYQAALAPVDGS